MSISPENLGLLPLSPPQDASNETEQCTIETSYLGTPWLVVGELHMFRGFRRKRMKLEERRWRWKPLHVTKYQCELLSIWETEITFLMELSPSCSGNKLCCQQEAFMSCKLATLKRHCSLLTHSPTEGCLVLWGMCCKWQWLIQKRCISIVKGLGFRVSPFQRGSGLQADCGLGSDLSSWGFLLILNPRVFKIKVLKQHALDRELRRCGNCH